MSMTWVAIYAGPYCTAINYAANTVVGASFLPMVGRCRLNPVLASTG